MFKDSQAALFERFPDDTKTYLRDFAARRPFNELNKILDSFRPLKVLTVGETIIDQYQYCVSIGRSAKDPTLVVRDLSTETFAGGIVAVANHLASFVDEVAMVTSLGDRQSYQGLVQEKLHRAVKPHYVVQKDTRTILKKRIVERYHFAKLIEVYEMDAPAPAVEAAYNRELCDRLQELLPQYDLVIAVDFGHGMITDDAVQLLSDKSKFLAVNAQANAGNFGYHTISRYPRVDYASMTERELRLEARKRDGCPKEIIASVANQIGCKGLAVTLGKDGCICHGKEDGTVQIPAVAGEVVDRIGSGDAYLGLSSLCAATRPSTRGDGLFR